MAPKIGTNTYAHIGGEHGNVRMVIVPKCRDNGLKQDPPTPDDIKWAPLLLQGITQVYTFVGGYVVVFIGHGLQVI